MTHLATTRTVVANIALTLDHPSPAPDHAVTVVTAKIDIVSAGKSWSNTRSV